MTITDPEATATEAIATEAIATEAVATEATDPEATDPEALVAKTPKSCWAKAGRWSVTAWGSL
jgi:hypothetical protein